MSLGAPIELAAPPPAGPTPGSLHASRLLCRIAELYPSVADPGERRVVESAIVNVLDGLSDAEQEQAITNARGECLPFDTIWSDISAIPTEDPYTPGEGPPVEPVGEEPEEEGRPPIPTGERQKQRCYQKMDGTYVMEYDAVASSRGYRRVHPRNCKPPPRPRTVTPTGPITMPGPVPLAPTTTTSTGVPTGMTPTPTAPPPPPPVSELAPVPSVDVTAPEYIRTTPTPTPAPTPTPSTSWTPQAQPISTQYSWGGAEAAAAAEQAAAACPPGQFWDGVKCRGAIDYGALQAYGGAAMAPGAAAPGATSVMPTGGMTAPSYSMTGPRRVSRFSPFG